MTTILKQPLSLLLIFFCVSSANFSQECRFKDLKKQIGKYEKDSKSLTYYSNDSKVAKFYVTYDYVKDKKNGQYYNLIKKSPKMKGLFSMTYNIISCSGKHLLKKHRFSDIEILSPKEGKTGFILTDREGKKYHMRLYPFEERVELTPLSNLEHLGIIADDFVLAIEKNAAKENIGYLMSQNWDTLMILPDISKIDYTELGKFRHRQKKDRRRYIDKDYSIASGNNYFIFKTKREKDSSYAILSDDGEMVSPLLPKIKAFSYPTKFVYPDGLTSEMIRHHAVPLDPNEDIYLPIEESGLFKPIIEDGLMFYQPIYLNDFFSDIKSIDNYQSSNYRGFADNYYQNGYILGWIKVYEIDGKVRFGYSNIDRTFETGPIWIGKEYKASISNQRFNYSNWLANSIEVYGYCPVNLYNDGNNLSTGAMQVIYAQLLDGTWQAYNVWDNLTPIFDTVQPDKATMLNAIANFHENITKEQKAFANALALKYEKQRKEREAQKLEELRQMKLRWNTLMNSDLSSTSYAEFNELFYISFVLQSDYPARVLNKTIDSNLNLDFSKTRYDEYKCYQLARGYIRYGRTKHPLYDKIDKAYKQIRDKKRYEEYLKQEEERRNNTPDYSRVNQKTFINHQDLVTFRQNQMRQKQSQEYYNYIRIHGKVPLKKPKY